MLNHIVQLALRHRGVVLALAVLVVGYGIYIAAQAKLDVFPEFVQPQVVIQSEAPGLAPEQVEALVTRPVESAVNGVGSVESMRSESIQGLSVITVVFQEGTDIYLARQMLTERLAATAGSLPLGVKSPKMSPLTSSTMDLLKFGLVSDKLSAMELRTFADWTVRPRVLAVPGVAKVSVFGGDVRQLQVQVNPDRLIGFDLSIQDVLAAARESTGVRGAGFIETAAQRIVIQTEGQSLDAQTLGEVVLRQHEGRSVRLKDVANVIEAPEPKFGDALVMGRPGVLLTMSGQYGANTMEVTESVERALEEMKPAFAAEGITYVPRLHRPATFIENALRNIKSSLWLGGLLVVAVLWLFLLDARIAFISFTAIPLSLLAAVIVLDHFGVTLNTMTLGGFAMAIGVVVDDAIIDVENILRRVREKLGQAQGGADILPGLAAADGGLAITEPAGKPGAPEGIGRKPALLFPVVLNASLEVRSAIVYATFIVALVFLPVLTMTGLQGRFFAPLGVAFILATLASLVVALTVTPALCLALLSWSKPHAEPAYVRWMKDTHRKLVAWASQYPRGILAAAAALFAAAVATLPFFGGEFLPAFREGHFVLQVSAAPGTSLTEMLRIGRQISQALLQNTNIATIEQQVGRAELGEDTWGPHRSEFHVELKPVPAGAEEKIQDAIRDTLGKFPGIQSEVLTFLGDRISETLAGETAEVVVNIFGDDLNLLDEKAEEVAKVLSAIPGATDVQVKSPPGAPRVVVRLRSDRLLQFGYRPLEALEGIQTAFQGAVVAQIYEGNRVFDVAVILDETSRQDPERLGSLMLRNAQGVRLPLQELADIELSSGRFAILHDGARRRQTVTCNTRGRDVASFVAEAKPKIAAQVRFPSGIYAAFSGTAEEQSRAKRQLLLHSLMAACGIVLLLAGVFRNGRNVTLVLANLPFALVGGVLAAYLAGRLGGEGTPSLSLGSLVGFVTLFGITMRNSIMMISHFDHLVKVERLTWGVETMLRGASERLLPILMTALVTALGLLPLAIGTGEAGREIEGPMALVILGGLITSTALNLLVLPVLALRYGRFGNVSPELALDS